MNKLLHLIPTIGPDDIALLDLISREYRSSSKQANRRADKAEADRLMNRSLEVWLLSQKLQGNVVNAEEAEHGS